jgi:hypothetical protein
MRYPRGSPWAVLVPGDFGSGDVLGTGYIWQMSIDTSALTGSDIAILDANGNTVTNNSDDLVTTANIGMMNGALEIQASYSISNAAAGGDANFTKAATSTLVLPRAGSASVGVIYDGQETDGGENSLVWASALGTKAVGSTQASALCLGDNIIISYSATINNFGQLDVKMGVPLGSLQTGSVQTLTYDMGTSLSIATGETKAIPNRVDLSGYKLQVDDYRTLTVEYNAFGDPTDVDNGTSSVSAILTRHDF